MIVLNGEPFIRYNLRALYPFAHQIIVVEGAAPAAAPIATSNGHSNDTTLESIQRFQAEEDPEKKVILVTAEDEGYPDGFWPGEKDEMCQAYAKRATGDYLWQVDSDEFYMPEDMEKIINLLEEDPEITAVSFKMVTFWGGLDYVVDGWYLQRGAQYYHRLFKWGRGYKYISHRPPTVTDPEGRDLRKLNWFPGEMLEKHGIYLHHYSLLFPKQVREKCAYYETAPWAKRDFAVKWFENDFMNLMRPYRVHNVYDYPSWLIRYSGGHPAQIVVMMNDIESKKINITLRHHDDIERLLDSSWYSIGRFFLRLWEPVNLHINKIKRRVQNRMRQIKNYFIKAKRKIGDNFFTHVK